MESLRERISTLESCSAVSNDVFQCRQDDVDEDDEADIDIEDVESENDERKGSTKTTNNKFSIESLLRHSRETSTSESLMSNVERRTSNAVFNKNVSMSAAISALLVNKFLCKNGY